MKLSSSSVNAILGATAVSLVLGGAALAQSAVPRGQVMSLEEALRLEQQNRLRNQFPDERATQPASQPRKRAAPAPKPKPQPKPKRQKPRRDDNITVRPAPAAPQRATDAPRRIEVPDRTIRDALPANETSEGRANNAPSGAGARITAAEIDAATFTGAGLPKGLSPLTAKVQILLDRSNTSPGIIDGFKGGMSNSAIREFERLHNMKQDGILDQAVWDALGGSDAGSLMTTYRIVEADTQGLTPGLPRDYAKLAKLDAMGYERVSERLAERFHMGEEFLKRLNPGARFVVGEELTVVAPGKKAEGSVARIAIDKRSQRLKAYDSAGNIISDYPVTIGSTSTPSPSGSYDVTAVAVDPNYTYNPKNFKQGDNEKILILPPGPNGPVGSTWIDLSRPSYGIHGTPRPDLLFTTQSHGCVRMTNWDAEELAAMVHKGTFVEFIE